MLTSRGWAAAPAVSRERAVHGVTEDILRDHSSWMGAGGTGTTEEAVGGSGQALGVWALLRMILAFSPQGQEVQDAGDGMWSVA